MSIPIRATIENGELVIRLSLKSLGHPPDLSTMPVVTSIYPKSIKVSTKGIQEHIEEIYALYPRKKGKLGALKAIEKAIRAVTKEKGFLLVAVAYLKQRTTTYAKLTRDQEIPINYIPYPATWFNAGSYDDEELQPEAEEKTEHIPDEARARAYWEQHISPQYRGLAFPSGPWPSAWRGMVTSIKLELLEAEKNHWKPAQPIHT